MQTKKRTELKHSELNDTELDKVNGGMDITVDDIPYILRPLFRFFFKTKKLEPEKKNNNTNTDTVITGPIYAEDGQE